MKSDFVFLTYYNNSFVSSEHIVKRYLKPALKELGIEYGKDNNSGLKDGTRANQDSERGRGTPSRINESDLKDGTGFGSNNGQGNRR